MPRGRAAGGKRDLGASQSARAAASLRVCENSFDGSHRV